MQSADDDSIVEELREIRHILAQMLRQMGGTYHPPQPINTGAKANDTLKRSESRASGDEGPPPPPFR